MQAVSDLHGSVRLRNLYRLALYRDFAADPLRPEEGNDGALFELEPRLAVLRDWQFGSDQIVQRPYARGSVYSIYLPVLGVPG